MSNEEVPQPEYVGFDQALIALKEGKRVGRSEWGGEDGLFLYLVEESDFPVGRAPLNKWFPEGFMANYAAHIDIGSPLGNCGTWTPAMYDIMQNDWVIFNEDGKVDAD